MAPIRAFVAVDVGETVRERAAAWCRHLAATGPDYRWVQPENYHVTLKFLGAVEPAVLSRVEPVLGQTAAAVRPFELRFQGLGCFPGWTNPRVLWVGVAEGQSELALLARAVDRGLSALGFAPEERPFRGHLTVARQRSDRGLADLRDAAQAIGPDAPAGTHLVTAILLLESKLSPAGPAYSVRGRYALGGVCG